MAKRLFCMNKGRLLVGPLVGALFGTAVVCTYVYLNKRHARRQTTLHDTAFLENALKDDDAFKKVHMRIVVTDMKNREAHPREGDDDLIMYQIPLKSLYVRYEASKIKAEELKAEYDKRGLLQKMGSFEIITMADMDVSHRKLKVPVQGCDMIHTCVLPGETAYCVSFFSKPLTF
jgi:hypothetical protein